MLMFRVREEFVIHAKTNVNSVEVAGFSVGSERPSKEYKYSIRICAFIKDYGTRENYEKNFKVLNEDFVNALKTKLSVSDEDLPLYENKVNVILIDDIDDIEPMTWRKWHEERIKNRK